MFSNFPRIWFFVLCVTSFSETENTVYYNYIDKLYMDNRMDEKMSYIIIPKIKERYITRHILNLLDLPIKRHHSANETWQMKRSSSRYIYDIFYNTIGKNLDQSYNFTRQDFTIIEESDFIITYAALLYHSDVSDIWFDVSITPKVDYVISAELHVYPNILDKSFTILVFSHVPSKKNKQRLHFIGSVDVKGNYKGWIKLNITEILKYWLNHPEHNNGLQLFIDYNKQKIDVDTATNEDRDIDQIDKHPFLVGYFASFEASNERLAGRSRWKRSQLYSSTNYLDNPYIYKDSSRRRLNSGSCRLQKLYVRFRDLEFDDFIVAPEGYEAQYCTGECRFPLNAHMNATNHAIVQTLVHFLMPGRAPQTCCAPRELAHLPVLYSRDGINHIIKKYRNMIIKSCGCH